MRAPVGVDILSGMCGDLVHLRIEEETMPQELHLHDSERLSSQNCTICDVQRN